MKKIRVLTIAFIVTVLATMVFVPVSFAEDSGDTVKVTVNNKSERDVDVERRK